MKINPKKRKKSLIRFLMYLFIAGIIYSIIVCSVFYFTGKNAKPVKSDVIIVLGCQVVGTTPSLMLQNRMIKALEVYNEGYGSYIIASGGQGKTEDITEAEAMKRWFVSKGVPVDKIIKEDKSTSTYENIIFSKKIMDEKNLGSAVIVTTDYHVFRSLFTAKRFGLEASGAGAQCVYYLRAINYLREILSVSKSLITDWPLFKGNAF